MVRTKEEIDKTVKEMSDTMAKQWKENGLADKLNRDRNIETNQRSEKLLKALGILPSTNRYTDPPSKKINERYNAEVSRY
jgi:hypothetical protein